MLVPTVRLELEIRSFVDEFIWKLRKSPLYPVEGFAPRNVPEAEPPFMRLLPRRTSVDVVPSSDVLAIWNLARGFIV